MSKNSKILYGILAFAPFILGLIAMFGMFSMFPDFIELAERTEGSGEPNPDEIMMLFTHMGKFFVPLMLAAFTGIVALIVYIIHIAQDKTASSGDRVLWILLMVFFGQMVFPIYFFVRIMKQHSIDDVKPEIEA